MIKFVELFIIFIAPIGGLFWIWSYWKKHQRLQAIIDKNAVKNGTPNARSRAVAVVFILIASLMFFAVLYRNSP